MKASWHVAHPPQKPTLAFDGDCSFCRRWKERWRDLTGTKIDYVPYQSVVERYPEIPVEEFGRGVKLIEPSGAVCSSAAAVYRSLWLGGQKRWLCWLYQKVPPFAGLSELGYD